MRHPKYDIHQPFRGFEHVRKYSCKYGKDKEHRNSGYCIRRRQQLQLHYANVRICSFSGYVAVPLAELSVSCKNVAPPIQTFRTGIE